MSVKHVKKYYKEIEDQYFEMLQDIKDFEKEASENLIAPERVDQLKEMISPLKINYERLSYIMYLLNLPNKKTKQKGYIQRNNKLLKEIGVNNSAASVLQENRDVLTSLKKG